MPSLVWPLAICLIQGPNIPGSYAILLLQHQTLLPSPVTSTSACCFCFGSISLFFLKFVLHWSPAAYWAHRSGEFIFQHSIFLPFLIFMGFSRQESWSGLPFHSPVVHVLSELSTMTCLSWVALHGMAHSFIELDKAVVHVIRLISFLWLWFLVFPPFGWEGPSYPQFYLHSHSSQVTNSPCIFGQHSATCGLPYWATQSSGVTFQTCYFHIYTS